MMPKLKAAKKLKLADSNEEIYSCDFCNKNFKKISYLAKHKKQKHSTEVELNILNCIFCKAKFLTKTSLQRHTKKYHFVGEMEEISKFECDFDGRIFKTKRLLLAHMSVHYPKVECSVCHMFVRKVNLNSHMKTHFGTGLELQCNFCSKTFKTKSLLKNHQPLHIKEFECEICNKMFTHLRHVRKHKKEIHDNSENFECSTCGKTFNRKYGLKVHQLIHDKNAPKHLKCQKCNYKTNFRRDYEQHQKFHVRKEETFAAMKNPLKCDKCFFFYPTPKKLRIHLITSHPKNPFQCDLCGKYINTKKSLRNHIKICINKKIKNY
ncbi:hypothetical protein ACKWTF_004190 [Chironomus riparius]